MDEKELEKKIGDLPRWAQVAFAARCAERAFPLFERWAMGRKNSLMKTVTDAIDISYHAASNTTKSASDSRDASSASSLCKLAADNADANADNASKFASSSAAAAARSAADAADAASKAIADAAIVNANPFYKATTKAVIRSAATAKVLSRKAVIADFNLLVKKAKEEGWDDDTPVPRGVFGPMSPDGASDWDPEPSSKARFSSLDAQSMLSYYTESFLPPEFTVWIDPGNAKTQDIADLFAALSDLDRVHGGNGLTFVRDDSEKPLALFPH